MTDQSRRLLQQKMAQHPNCRASVVPWVEEGTPAWDTQRVTSFWDAYFIRTSNDG